MIAKKNKKVTYFFEFTEEEAKILKGVLQNAQCSHRNSHEEPPCESCKTCILSKKIFKSID